MWRVVSKKVGDQFFPELLVHYKIMFDIVLGIFKSYDVSEAGSVTIIRYKRGKGSYSAGSMRQS
jgi:hypothetical protein